MFVEHAIWLIGIPFILFLVGAITKKSLPLIVGGIGLLVFGIVVLASPMYVQQLDNITTHYTYDNVTEAGNLSAYEWQMNQTVEQYNYNNQEFPANDNLMFGVILSFLGLAGLGYGVLVIRG